VTITHDDAPAPLHTLSIGDVTFVEGNDAGESSCRVRWRAVALDLAWRTIREGLAPAPRASVPFVHRSERD
jgi:hypothetical protein